MKVIILAILVLSVLAQDKLSMKQQKCTPCKSINKVCNPSFEYPIINGGRNGWTQKRTIPYWSPTEQTIEIWRNLGGKKPRHGNQNLELRPNIPEGVRQTINNLEKGMTYQINFSASARSGVKFNTFRVWFNGKRISKDLTLKGKMKWYDQDGKFFFVAEKTNGNELKIEDPTPNSKTGGQNSVGTLLDYVSIAPCSCPPGIQNAKEHDMSLKACHTQHVNKCVTECYWKDEWKNELGSHKCENHCDCDGFRTCQKGWCEGDARPKNSKCQNPDEGENITYDYTDKQKCKLVTFYKECNYESEKFELKTTENCLKWPPKSICLPRGKKVTIWDLCEFKGMEATFTRNIQCIKFVDFDFLLEAGITVSGRTKYLKTNSAKQTEWKVKQADMEDE